MIDDSPTTAELIEMFNHYDKYLVKSGECIDNDCDVIAKPYAKIVADRLKALQTLIDDIEIYHICPFKECKVCDLIEEGKE